MLHNKYKVKYNGQDCQNHLCNVQSIRNKHTSAGEGEYASYKVKNNIENGPAFCGFSLPVPVDCRGVFEKTDNQLGVTHTADWIEVLCVR